MPDEDLRAGKDGNKRFFLLGPKPDEKKPVKGHGLLLVMAGGGGGEEFRGFVRDIYLNSAPEGCVLAHLVSKKWTPEQEIVWPKGRDKVAGAKFTTEEFIDAVVKEVKSRHPVDKRRVYTLSWSSSGPAAYAAAFRKKTPITGSLITMSVFYKAWYPSLKAAKGRPFYILHSPTDMVCRFNLAEDARDRLKKAGAKVEFKTYEGGHGWPPSNRFDLIEAGFRWLDSQNLR
jgi:predicted esterase